MRVGSSVNIPMPLGGVDQSTAKADQPPFTTTDALNVRGEDTAGRGRVSKRPGSVRHFSTQAVGDGENRIDQLEAFSIPTGSVGVSSPAPIGVVRFQYPTPADFGSTSDRWRFVDSAGSNTPVDGKNAPGIFSPADAMTLTNQYANDWRRAKSSAFAIGAIPPSGKFRPMAMMLRQGTTNDCAVVVRQAATSAGDRFVDAVTQRHATNYSIDNCGPFVRGQVNGSGLLTGFMGAFIQNLSSTGNRRFRLVIGVFQDDGTGLYSQFTQIAAGPEFQPPPGVLAQADASFTYIDAELNSPRAASVEIRLSATPTTVEAELVGWDDGQGDFLVDASLRPYRVTANNTALASNTRSGYFELRGTTANSLSGGFRPRALEAIHLTPVAASVQPAATGEATRITVFVAAYLRNRAWHGRSDLRLGNYITPGSDLQLVASPSGHAGREVGTVAAYKRFFSVDGATSKIIDPIANTETNWALSVTAGALPAGCRAIALYRGSLHLANQAENPSAWYASRVADWNDWDFGSTPEATAAVAGVNSLVGVPGDAIVAMIPIANDYLLFGCASSFWMLAGDIRFRGSINRLEPGFGLLGPRAWCYGEGGRIFVMTPAGLGVFSGGGFQNLTRGRVPELLEINTNTTRVMLAYDSVDRCVYIFLTPFSGSSAGSHWMYDIDGDAFWPLRFTTAAEGPFSVVSVQGDNIEERRFLYGGSDGRVRRITELAIDDDMTETSQGVVNPATGVAFEARVRSPIVKIEDGFLRAMMTELQIEGDTGNTTALSARVFGAATDAATVNATTPLATFTIDDATLTIKRMREQAGAIQLEMRSTGKGDRWAIDKALAWFRSLGRRRR